MTVETDDIRVYRDCEACGTPTPEGDLTDVQTVSVPLTVCPSCEPSGEDGHAE